jgi:hypothetical protein
MGFVCQFGPTSRFSSLQFLATCEIDTVLAVFSRFPIKFGLTRMLQTLTSNIQEMVMLVENHCEGEDTVYILQQA